jgi:WD40 repeat protein
MLGCLMSGAAALEFSDLTLRASVSAHRGTVTQIVRSPDGKQVAFASTSYVHVFNLLDGKLAYSLVGHRGFISSLAWRGDGKQILTSSYDNTAKIWQAGTGQLLRSVTVNAVDLNVAVFSPDGKSFATGGDDKLVRVFETETGKLLKTLKGHSEIVEALAYAPNGKLLASGDDKGELRIWSAKGELLKTIKSGQSIVRQVGFAPDSQTLASIGDNTLRLWSVVKWTAKVITDKEDKGILAFAWSPNSKRIAIAATDYVLRLVDLERNNAFGLLGKHGDGVNTVIYLDAKTVISGGVDGYVRGWDSAAKKQSFSFSGNPSRLKNVVYSSDGSMYATVANETDILVWNATDNSLTQTLKAGFPAWQTCLAFHPNGKSLVSGDDFGHVKLWDLQTGSLKNDVTGDDNSISSLAFSPDGQRLAFAGSSGNVGLVDSAALTKLASFPGFDESVTGLAWTADGATLVMAGSEGSIKTLLAKTGQMVSKLEPLDYGIRTLDLSPNGNQMVIATYDGNVQAMSLAGKSLWKTTLSSADPLVVRFSPDGSSIALGGSDGTVRLLDASDGKTLYSLTNHSDGVYALAFRPDGTRLLVGAGSLIAGGTFSVYGTPDDRSAFGVKTEAAMQPLGKTAPIDWGNSTLNAGIKVRFSNAYKLKPNPGGGLEFSSVSQPTSPGVLIRALTPSNYLPGRQSLLETALGVARENCAIETKLASCTDPITVAGFNTALDLVGYEINFSLQAITAGGKTNPVTRLPVLALDARAANDAPIVLLSIKPGSSISDQEASALLRDVANNLAFEATKP